MKDRFTIPEHVVERALGDRTILLSLRSGDYFSLNPSGSFFWKGLTAGRTAQDLAAEAARTYQQPLETIEADFAEFAAALEKLGLAE
jgi:hypothetical protein